jgi:hypothetical protein
LAISAASWRSLRVNKIVEVFTQSAQKSHAKGSKVLAVSAASWRSLRAKKVEVFKQIFLTKDSKALAGKNYLK